MLRPTSTNWIGDGAIKAVGKREKLFEKSE